MVVVVVVVVVVDVGGVGVGVGVVVHEALSTRPCTFTRTRRNPQCSPIPDEEPNLVSSEPTTPDCVLRKLGDYQKSEDL